MEEIASLWNYHEVMDELKRKIMYTNLELEQFKMESSEETRKNNEYVKQLIQLLKKTWKERDEARDQLQNLLNEIMPSTIETKQNPNFISMETNSCITQSNSTFLDTEDYSPMAFVNQDLARGYSTYKVDRATLEIESLVEGRNLPQNGKFLQAVVEAGPLLQTLLLTGPLPRWRNSPRLNPFHIPPVSLKSRGLDKDSEASRSSSSHLCVEMSCDSSAQMLSNSVTNFGGFPSGNCLGSQRIISAGNSGQLRKRQRFQ